jgi:hypothetical protein
MNQTKPRSHFIAKLAVTFLTLMWVFPAVASAQEEPYALDEVSRYVEPRGKVVCPKVELTRYKGDIIRYHKPVKVFVGFKDRLKKFEQVVKDTSIEFYGRAPKKIRHIGTYNCRRIGGYPTYISEHGLGNGIDVAGFDFGRLPGGATLPEGAPKRLKRGFRVRLLKHWKGRNAVNKHHSRFLRTLAVRLIEREDIFRVLLGPAYPGHKDHFHLDVSPWRIVEIFKPGEDPLTGKILASP